MHQHHSYRVDHQWRRLLGYAAYRTARARATSERCGHASEAIEDPKFNIGPGLCTKPLRLSQANATEKRHGRRHVHHEQAHAVTSPSACGSASSDFTSISTNDTTSMTPAENAIAATSTALRRTFTVDTVTDTERQQRTDARRQAGRHVRKRARRFRRGQ